MLVRPKQLIYRPGGQVLLMWSRPACCHLSRLTLPSWLLASCLMQDNGLSASRRLLTGPDPGDSPLCCPAPLPLKWDHPPFDSISTLGWQVFKRQLGFYSVALHGGQIEARSQQW